jgi:hypothetical protein
MPTSISKQQGRNQLFVEQWRFIEGDDAAAQSPSFDDATWRAVDLPHDWSIEGPFDSKLASCTAFLPCGIAWYRKHFVVPAKLADKSISIRFDGVSNHSTVYCNGQLVGERPYGYSSFNCESTPAIKFGAENVIAVRVDHEKYADSRWYAGSGIYRNVFLNVTDKLHVDHNGVFVTTPRITTDSAEIDVVTTVTNEGAARTSSTYCTVANMVKDAAGRIVARQDDADTPAVGAQPESAVKAILGIAHPALWSPDSPNMYTLVTQVKARDGTVIDEYVTPFGIRSFLFDPAKGLSINGKGMKLKGVCLHHDAGALGAAVPIEVWERRFKLLQEAGCNAIRCSHNPPAPEFLDLCDRMGFLVMDEAFDEWTKGKKKWVVGHDVGDPGLEGYHSDFDKWADIDIRDMVLRDRNHPSIILWSIGNEIDYQNDPLPPDSTELPPIAERLIKDVKAVDTSRPVTAACASPATNLFKKLLDVEGYNYMEKLYADDHAAQPSRVIYGSENSHSRPDWEAVANNDYIAGQFLWTGIDYLGEAGVWPSHGSGAGLLNLAGFPKNQYYYRQSLWSDTPMVYLWTHRLPKRHRMDMTPPESGIYCFTNCDEVELFHDGKSLGTQRHAPGEILTWPVDFAGGVLRAVGKKGSTVTTFELKHAGPAAKLVLKSDVDSLGGDGHRVAQIEVEVTDNDGTRVPNATHLVTCNISGPGQILGIEDGDLRSTENYKTSMHSVYQGRMLVYVQCSGSSGDINLAVSSPNLGAAALKVPVRIGVPREGGKGE